MVWACARRGISKSIRKIESQRAGAEKDMKDSHLQIEIVENWNNEEVDLDPYGRTIETVLLIYWLM